MIQEKYSISFEVFPPRTDAGTLSLFRELDILSEYNPDFISVTYGAGGSTREKTIEVAEKIKNSGTDVLVHFTCVGFSRTETAEYLEKLSRAGFSQILALRGDPPRDINDFVPHPDGFAYADELVAFIKEHSNFSVTVAGYPEGHPEAPSLDFDIDMLKKKIDSGAERIITQLFFDNNDFEIFLNKCIQKGISVPVIPGIMPVRNKAQLDRIIELSNSKIPEKFRSIINSCSIQGSCEASLDYTAEQICGLREMGITSYHLYPLNKSEGIARILRNGGIR